ncbi:AI-2E family transporter [Terriglobus albidus]|uniref:AI-2E family transporter n=1 Tax=Terriglobus albidus TaxID=1592106 RepID=UPI0021DF6835|nr:AI-2E family transporter [Terriglobus albidus]
MAEPPIINPPKDRAREIRGYILFTFLVMLAGFLAWKLIHELEILYVSAIFAVVLTPVVHAIMRWKIRSWSPSKGTSVLVLMIGILGLLTLLFWLGLPPVISDLKEFAQDLPSRIPGAIAKIKRIPMADRLGIDSVTQHVEQVLAATAGYIVAGLPKWIARVADIIMAIILTMYFILEGDTVYHYFLSMVPAIYRTRLDMTLQKAELRVSRWLIGQLSLMALQGVYSIIVFWSLHVRYFMLLGVLMGITNIIPVAGNLITIIIVFCVAAVDSWTKASLVLLFYVIYSQVENAWLVPRIMRSSVDLMGITVLVALLCGTAVAGIVGALVAVPTAALVAVIAGEYLVRGD